ncbi:universal stress protein [Microbacteriaceae bacterium VKM Ac-2854]|nr:universal stress protein [Microbacteriaceae bacterium VKM Ac-2854]
MTDAPRSVPSDSEHGAVVVGVVEGQSPAVLATALRTATDLGAPLLVAHVAPDPYLLGEYVDTGTGGVAVGSAAVLAAELDAVTHPVFPVELAATVESALAGSTVRHSLRVLSGEPALALGDIAERVDARMIVVGTREAGVLAGIAEFLSGSVAVHLAHRQHRPVLVVPQPDRNPHRTAPWDLA